MVQRAPFCRRRNGWPSFNRESEAPPALFNQRQFQPHEWGHIRGLDAFRRATTPSLECNLLLGEQTRGARGATNVRIPTCNVNTDQWHRLSKDVSCSDGVRAIHHPQPPSSERSRISRSKGLVHLRWRPESRTTGTRRSLAHASNVLGFTVKSSPAWRAFSSSSSEPSQLVTARLAEWRSRVIVPR
jgi:hypothetical protein